MTKPNTAKSAEFQVVIWFLEAGWELFTPVADLYGTDLVVREPDTRKLLSVQVKHKEPGSLNEGRLANDWRDRLPPFDYLVFFVPEKVRGLVLPSSSLTKGGKTFLFYKNDTEGYSRGSARKIFSE